MRAKNCVSAAERTLLLFLVFLTSFILFYNSADKGIDAYNREIKSVQESKKIVADGLRKSGGSFDLSSCGSMPLWRLFYWLQFLTTPLLYLLLKSRRIESLILSSLLTVLTFLSFLGWFYDTLRFVSYGDILSSEKTGLNHNFLYNSTYLECALFCLITILLVLQSAIIFRFAIEKFQAKLSLR